MNSIYEIEDYDIYKSKKDGSRYSVKGFSYRFPDKIECVLIEDTHFATLWVLPLTDFQVLFEKMPDDIETT